MNTFIDRLHQRFPHLVFQEHFLLSSVTTVKIGGPAELYCEVETQDDFIALIQLCKKEQIPLTVIGWGANTLIADRGIQGLVIKFKNQELHRVETSQLNESNPSVPARWQKGSTEDEYTDFKTIDYDESHAPTTLIEVSAGMPLPFLITQSLTKGLTGLQWFSRIPATVGGAIYNNIHGGTHFFSEFVHQVTIINDQANLQTLSPSQLQFDYDYSRFHETNEIIVSAQLKLFNGNTEKAKQVVQTWAIQKKDQPQNSLGCVFQNISEEDQKRLGYPTPSVGYIIDQVLRKKGFSIGDAKISEKHAAFIENTGRATADDYLKLIKLIIAETKQKTGISLKPEIFFKGFTKEELQEVTNTQK